METTSEINKKNQLRLIWSQLETLSSTDLFQSQELFQWNFNQELELIEIELSSVKELLSYSSRQQHLFWQIKQKEGARKEARENLLGMVRGISQIYSNLGSAQN